MSAHPVVSDDRFLSVQYLRAAAAFAVFFFHISAEIESRWGSEIAIADRVGAAGVDLFFVISGFIMAMMVARHPPSGAGSFFARRWLRVAPPYFLITFFVFAMTAIAPGLFNATFVDFERLTHSLLFLPMERDGAGMAPLLLVGWTLNYEIAFYALVAIAAGVFGDRRLIGTTAVLLLAVLAGALFSPSHPVARFYTDPIIIEFAFGIFIWQLWEGGQGRNRAASLVLGLLALVALLLQFELDPGSARPILWGVPVAMILYASLGLLTFRSRILATLGDWSYAFYLTHLFVVAFWVRLAVPAMTEAGLTIPWQLHYLAITVMGISAAGLFYTFVERPLMAVVRRPRRKPIAGAAVVPGE